MLLVPFHPWCYPLPLASGRLDWWRSVRYNLSEETLPRVLHARAAAAAPLRLPRWFHKVPRYVYRIIQQDLAAYCGPVRAWMARIRVGTKELLIAA